MKHRAGKPARLLGAPCPDTMCKVPLLVEWDRPFDYERASPHDGVRAPDIPACIDFGLLNDIFENFLEVTGLPIAIIDLDARVLASSRWQRLCMEFHRVNRHTLAGCIKSDTVLSKQVQEGCDVAIYQCPNGLTDCATPIVVDGRHVANLFIGQFLSAEPDMAFFKSQQERYGFDEAAYFDALSGIPIVSEHRIPAILKLLRGLAQQIAQQSLAESQLHAATRMLQTVIDNVPHDVFWKDSESRYLGCNHNVAKLAGVAGVRDIVGRTDDELPWRTFAAVYRNDDAQIMASGIAKKIVEPRDLGNGSIRWLETNKVPLKDAQGHVFGVLGLSQDITERLQTEAELALAKDVAERANEAKSRFLAAVSHDLRQPLSALSLYVDILEDKLPPSDEHLVATMKQCLAGLKELLSDLLDLSKLDAGAVSPEIGDFSVDELIAKVVSTLGPQAREKGLTIRYGRCGRFGRTDPVLFQRIIMNLVSNAVRYTERGAVLVGYRRARSKTWLEVWDTGIGIPADKTAEIFDEFKQLGNRERNREKGSGIGLSVVAKTAALLGLAVRVHSKVGRGSMFAVELPLGNPTARPAPEPRKIGRSLHIALVEDNIEVAKALAYSLRERGHRVDCALDCAGLVSALNGAAPDILISDYRLGSQDTGLNVVARMRSVFGEDLPAIIITGDTDPAPFRDIARQRISLVHKPLDLDVLEQAVSDLIANVRD